MDSSDSVRTFSRDQILSYRDGFPYSPGIVADFDKIYKQLVEIPHAYHKKKGFQTQPKLVKNKNAWKPSVPTTDNDKIRKIIKGVLNKISQDNVKIVNEELFTVIKRFNNYDILDILSQEILDKIIFDQTFQDIYINIYESIKNNIEWHKTLITVIQTDNKVSWHKNISGDDIKIYGPFDTKVLALQDVEKNVNIRLNFGLKENFLFRRYFF